MASIEWHASLIGCHAPVLLCKTTQKNMNLLPSTQPYLKYGIIPINPNKPINIIHRYIHVVIQCLRIFPLETFLFIFLSATFQTISSIGVHRRLER